MRKRYYSEKTVKRIISWVCPGTYFIEDIKDRIKRAKHISIPDKHGDLKDANAILRWLNAKADNRVPVTVGEIIDFIEKQPTVLEASE